MFYGEQWHHNILVTIVFVAGLSLILATTALIPTKIEIIIDYSIQILETKLQWDPNLCMNNYENIKKHCNSLA